MVGEQHLPFVLYAIFTAVLLIEGSQEVIFKAGKINTTTKNTGLFACEKITFARPFSGGKQVKVFASSGHSVNSQTLGNGAAIWVESVDRTQFRACIYEYRNGSNTTAEINWIALQSAPPGAQLGTTSLESWTTGTECKKIYFPQRFLTSPTLLATPSHQFPERPQDAMAVWVEELTEDSFKICLRENWMAYTNLSIGNFTLTDSLLFTNYNLLSQQANHAFCQHINFTDEFYAPPVVIVTAKRINNDSRLSGCNAITAWVEYTSTAKTEICVRVYETKSKDTIKVDYLITGGFPFQRDRRHMPHIPSLGYSHCEVIGFRPFVFYPDKPVQVQVTVNHIDTRDMNYVHDAAVPWIEDVTYQLFTAYVMAAGFNERRSRANASIDWIAYQGAPEGGISGEVHMSQWWTGTTCKTVRFPSFPKEPSVFVTVAHHHAGLKRDAASIWLEDITRSSFKTCLRELQNYAGSHEDIYVNWLAFSSLDKPMFSEHSSVYFANSQKPAVWNNNAFCKDISFTKLYKNAPSVFVSANHTSSGGGQDPMHNSITAWVEYINTTGARVCTKELYDSKYDPLSVSYTVLSGICQPGWSYFSGYCYFTSRTCGSWLTAVSNCSTMSSSLVTVHNQNENVYIQHRPNGERSWIGLNDRSVEGSFVWTNKEISKFRFWAPQQPNDWKNEDCVHTLGAKHGYTWNDVPCHNCYNYTCFKDIDECSANTHSCDVNAMCSNTLGSYACSCKAGYSGDGRTCTDIDECSTNSHICDVNAVCGNTVGSYTCACKPGYSGNGRTCSDIDECSTNSHSCDVNAVCGNTLGSYTCACKPGYSGNGRTCSDIDECSTSSHSCDVNAVCSNTVGSYACACKAGFTGDGNTCSDIDECTRGTHNCHSSLASCTNTVGSFSCSCNSPSSGDGRTCNLPSGNQLAEY
ncbi:unnamed protein product [Porites lobata]|uniref:Uncharacterized protein n=1 Tax=Porites lobata TaxID=104759 RepID=A0ABN8SCM8_9CNID|nr:unnamed protein product [Porites lobata]